MVRTTRICIALFATALLLAGCSSGGGGGGSATPVTDPVAVTPQDDESAGIQTPVGQEPVPEPGPMVDSDQSELVDAEPVSPVVDDPIVDPGVDEIPPEQDFGALSDLFGRAFFGHRFIDGETLFVFAAVYGPTTVFTADDGLLVLSAEAVGALRQDGDEDFTATANIPLTCAFLEQNEVFVCVGSFSDGATTNFLFGRLVDGEASGNFQFCAAEVSGQDCIADLVNNPSGGVGVLVDSDVTVAALESSTIPTSASRADQTLISYLEYGSQITNGGPDTARLAKRDFAAMESIRQTRDRLLGLAFTD